MCRCYYYVYYGYHVADLPAGIDNGIGRCLWVEPAQCYVGDRHRVNLSPRVFGVGVSTSRMLAHSRLGGENSRCALPVLD